MKTIGVDLDNTIVCYDEVFHRVAVERGLIPAHTPVRKTAVKEQLCLAGREDVWTALQGLVYGPRMAEAEPYPGVLEFFTRCRQLGQTAYIISHRSQHPYAGPAYDLHEFARQWLSRRGFHDYARVALPPGKVFLETGKASKLARIAQAGCTHFVDDLPEFLTDPAFPPGVERILFDPNGRCQTCPAVVRAGAWNGISEYLLGGL